MEDLKKYIRDVPDFPKPGIVFKDITPLLLDAKAFKQAISIWEETYLKQGITKIVGIDSRGFIFGAALALKMGLGFVPVRKAGKLPWTTESEEYILEYGTDKVEIHADALDSNDKVLIIDDLLATGGTAAATIKLVEKIGATVHAISFLVELDFLKGREKLVGKTIFSLMHF